MSFAFLFASSALPPIFFCLRESHSFWSLCVFMLQHWYVTCHFSHTDKAGGGGGKGSTRQLSKDRGGGMRGAGNVWGQLGEFVINCGLASPNPPPKFTRWESSRQQFVFFSPHSLRDFRLIGEWERGDGGLVERVGHRPTLCLVANPLALHSIHASQTVQWALL